MTRSDSTVLVTRLGQVITLTLTRLGQVMTLTLTRLEKILDDFDSTKMTRTHHWFWVFLNMPLSYCRFKYNKINCVNNEV